MASGVVEDQQLQRHFDMRVMGDDRARKEA